MSFTLYRMRGAHGELFYVGQTSNVGRRILAHRDKSWWRDVTRIDLEHYDTKEEVLEAEHCAHLDDRPLFSMSQHQCGQLGAWERSKRQRDAHAAGERCRSSRCHECTLLDLSEEMRGDARELILSLHAIGRPADEIADHVAWAAHRREPVSRSLVRSVIASWQVRA